MKINRTSTLLATLIIAALATLLGLTWANYSYSYQGPINDEFLARYAATRVFLLEGESPYGDRADQEIENLASRGNQETQVQSSFLDPFYSVYLMAPFSLIPDYNLARAIWMTVLEISIIGIVLLSIALSRWKISFGSLVVLILFSVFWYHSFLPLINGDLTVIVALFIVLALMAVRARNDGLAGFLLAFSSINPAMMVLLAFYVMIWSIAQKRWHLFWGFVSSLGIMIATSFLFIPDWMMQYLRNVIRDPVSAFGMTPRQILVDALPGVGDQLAWVFTITMISAMIVEWRSSSQQDFPWFFWTAMLTLVATNLIGIPTSPANFVVMLPAMVLVFSAWDTHWRTTGKWLVALSMIFLFGSLWWFFWKTMDTGSPSVTSPVVFFTAPFFLSITLYWVRWWVLHPSSPMLEQWRRLQKP